MVRSFGALAAVLALLSLSLAIWPGTRTLASARLRRLAARAAWPGRASGPVTALDVGVGVGSADDDPSTGRAAARRRALLFAGLAGSAVLATFPSVVGALAAGTVSAGSYLLLRWASPADGTSSRPGAWMNRIRWRGGTGGRSAEADPRLPFAIDLLAVCLRAGLPTSSALRSVAGILSAATSRPVGGAATAFRVPGVSMVLARVAAASELGSEPATAWEDWIGHPVYGPLARALVVTGESGSAVAGRLEAVSHQLRTATGQQAMARAQRAGVALMAPLGLCFLPAFVCLGVVPVIVGIAGRVFG